MISVVAYVQITDIKKFDQPLGSFGKMAEISKGKGFYILT